MLFLFFIDIHSFLLCSLDCENNEYNVYVSNDSLNDIAADIEIYKVVGGAHRHVCNLSVLCPANECVRQRIDVDLAEGEFLIAELKSTLNDCGAFYRPSHLHISPCDEAIEYSVENNCIVITANRYVHAIELEGDAVFEENGFSMLCGESKRIPFRTLSKSAYNSLTYSKNDISVTAYSL